MIPIPPILQALPWKLIGAVLVALALFLGGARWGAGRVQERWDADKFQQAAALDAARDRLIEQEREQAEAARAAEERYASLQTDYGALGDRLADSLRKYAALRARPVPTAAPGAPAPADSSGSAGSDGEGSGLPGLLGDAFQACYRDAAKLTALQDWARSIGH